MPFTPAPPVAPPKPAGTGITCCLLISKRGANAFRLIVSEEAQRQYFGGSMVDKEFAIGVGRGVDEGRLLIHPVEQGGFKATRSFRDSAAIKIGAWDLLPKDKRPSQSGKVLRVTPEGVVIELPKWAMPSAPDGKMGAEFALKPVPRAGDRAASLAEAGDIMTKAVRK